MFVDFSASALQPMVCEGMFVYLRALVSPASKQKVLEPIISAVLDAHRD